MSGDGRPGVARVGAGILLMAFPLTLLLSPVAAQEASDPEPLTIDESTLYVSSATAVLPNTITNDVPPTAFCIVVPDACPPALDPVRDPSRELVGDAADLDISTMFQPVPPDTISVAYLGGNTRYQSAIRFEAPTAPTGEQIDRFELLLPQAQPTFELDSPAFRRAVLAVFETISTEDPELVVNGLVDALENHEPIDLSQKVGIEACPLTAPFEAEGAPMARSERDLPHDPETGEPAIDCVLGAIGEFDAGDSTWRLDLTFAAQAWADGDLDNNGVLLRPIGALNLAFGDPDPTTNAQIGLDIASASAVLATAAPVPSAGPPSSEPPPTLGGGTGFDVGDEVPLGLPPVAAPAPADNPPTVAPPPEPPTAVPEPVRSVIEQPWWMWLAIPAFALGAWLALSGLVAPAVATAAGPSGAMTRLLAR